MFKRRDICPHISRRIFLREISTLGLTAIAWKVMDFPVEAAISSQYNPQQDIFYLNTALKQEYAVILSYDFAIETGLFEKAALTMMAMIQQDHIRHRRILRTAIERLGGEPEKPMAREEFEKRFNTDLLRVGTDALRLSKRFESECYSVYGEIATYLRDPTLAAMASRHSAEEMMHRALLVQGIASIPEDQLFRIRD